MVYTKNFKFGSKLLGLKSLEELDPEVEQNIQFILDKYSKELNHNIQGSSAKKINDAYQNIPISFSKEFIDFLDYNMDFALNLKEYFTPFHYDQSSNVNLKDLYIKDSQKNGVVKVKSFKLDSSFLRSSYIVELLKNYLKESSINNYSIVLPNVKIASGDLKWESRFEESELFKGKVFQLKNSSALLIENTPLKDIMIVGKDLGLLKALEKRISNIKDENSLDELASQFSLDIVIFEGEDLKIFQRMD